MTVNNEPKANTTESYVESRNTKNTIYKSDLRCVSKFCPWKSLTALANSKIYWKHSWLPAEDADTATKLTSKVSSKQIQTTAKTTKQLDWLLLCGCAALQHNPVFNDVCFKRWMMKQAGLEALMSYAGLWGSIFLKWACFSLTQQFILQKVRCISIKIKWWTNIFLILLIIHTTPSFVLFRK